MKQYPGTSPRQPHSGRLGRRLATLATASAVAFGALSATAPAASAAETRDSAAATSLLGSLIRAIVPGILPGTSIQPEQPGQQPDPVSGGSQEPTAPSTQTPDTSTGNPTAPTAGRDGGEVVPFWGDINPEGYSRSVPSGAGDPYWVDPRTRFGSVPGYLHLADLDFWSDSFNLTFGRTRNDGLPEERFIRWTDEPGFATVNGTWGARYRNRVENGFVDTPVRSMQWHRVQFGAWCLGPDQEVGFNQFLGRYGCLPNRDWMNANRPGYDAAKEQCVSGVGVVRDGSWTGSPNVWEPVWDGSAWIARCHDLNVSDPETRRVNAQDFFTFGFFGGESDCAPWENQSLSKESLPLCNYEFYSWAGDPVYPQGGYFPPPGTGGGGGSNGVTREATRTASVTVTGSQTAEATRTVKVTRDRVTVRVSRFIRGKRYTASGNGRVRVSATASASHTETLNDVVTVSRTASCTEATAAAAQECANNLAQQRADAAAQQAADKAVTGDLLDAAREGASRKAAQMARDEASSKPIPAAAVKSAKRKARDRALTKIANQAN